MSSTSPSPSTHIHIFAVLVYVLCTIFSSLATTLLPLIIRDMRQRSLSLTFLLTYYYMNNILLHFSYIYASVYGAAVYIEYTCKHLCIYIHLMHMTHLRVYAYLEREVAHSVTAACGT